MASNIGYATNDANSSLRPWPFDRAEVGPEDVLIDIVLGGVCHSYVHQNRDELGGPWRPTTRACPATRPRE